MTLDTTHDFGDIVFVKTDRDQRPRQVTAIVVREYGYHKYELSCGTDASWHTAAELTTERDILLTTTNY